MKRGLLVLACLLFLVSTTWADYIIIRVNLGNTAVKVGEGGPPQPPPGAGGGFNLPGGRGDAPGGAGTLGGKGGRGAGLSGGGLQAPGGRGQGGASRPGGAPGGFSGPLGSSGGSFTRPGAGQRAAEENEDLRGNWFIAVVQTDVRQDSRQRNTPHNGYYLTTKYNPGAPMALDPGTVIPGEIVLQRIPHQNLEKLLASRKSQYKDDPFRLAEWMLQHWNFPNDDGKFDMQEEFEKYIDELGTKGSLEGAAKVKVEALRAVRDGLKKSLGDPAAELAQILNLPGLGPDYRQSKSAHYVILHRGKDESEALRKLKLLERAYAGFFYWFALMGQPAKAPQNQLIAILPEDGEKFRALHRVFDSLPMVNDGFFANLDNVAIISKTRVDGPFEQFQTIASEFDKNLSITGLSLDKLLDSRKIPRSRPNDSGAPNPTDMAKGKILALATHAAREEGELATTTFEGIQQLFAATGLLPRRVQLPQSVRFGLASFFETPKSYGELHYPSLWSGMGGVHWTHVRFFKKLSESEKNGALTFDKGAYWNKSVKFDKLSLLKIITDQSFDALPKAKDEDRDVLRDKARAEAWSVSHFLLRQRLPQTLKFWTELSQMPRDMELTPEVIESCFARAFEMTDANNPDRADAEKLAALDKAWRDFMNFQNLELNPLYDSYIDKPIQRRTNSPAAPGGGGQGSGGTGS